MNVTKLPWQKEKKLTLCSVFTSLVWEYSEVRVCLHASSHFCPEVFVEESHQLFGFLRLLPRLYSFSLHRSSDVLPGCLSLFACDASQLLLYNGLLLLIPVQAHTDKPLFTCLLPSHDSLTAVLNPVTERQCFVLCS